ncbi:MAG: TorF family putative porin [Kiritimatiellia bacterium]
MRKRIGWMTLAAAGMMAAGLDVRGADVSADLPILSAYVWRGQVLNDEAVIQPALNVVTGGWGVNVWGNFNATDRVTGDADFSEIDLTLSYGGRLGPAAYGVGVIEYLFPNTDYASTREIYVSLSLPDAPVVPTLSVYRDVEEADGFYASFALSKTYKIGDKTTLGLSASLGAGDEDYNAFYFGVDDAALNDVNAGATLSFALSDTVTLVPGVQYTWLPDPDIRDGAEALYFDTEQLTGSLKLTLIF